MTAITVNTSNKAVSIRPIYFVGLGLGILIIMAYSFLPFINQPELGATTIPVLTESRSNNELGIVLNGLVIIPMAALSAILLSIWNLVSPKIARTVGVLLALSGVMGLVYHIIFFKAYLEEGGEHLGAMGSAFWLILALNVLLIIQVLIPREATEERYRVRKVLGNQESVLIFGLILLVFVVGIINPRFLAERNVSDVLQGHAYIAVAALGMSMVIVTGNIDISVGSLIGLLAVMSGRLVVGGAPVWASWLIPVLAGMAIGAFIGFLVAYLRIPSIVVTLGMLSILKGGMIIWTGGQRVIGMPDEFYLAQMRPLGIPMPIVFMIVLTILAALWMRYSATGRSLYAVGGNTEAARLSGISYKRTVMTVFIINGMFVGIASILYATQLKVVQPTPPPALELLIITASVVGGVSILGGVGTAIGSTIAAILLNVIRSGMIFIDISPFWLQAVQGIMILVTVLADLLRRRRQAL